MKHAFWLVKTRLIVILLGGLNGLPVTPVYGQDDGQGYTHDVVVSGLQQSPNGPATANKHWNLKNKWQQLDRDDKRKVIHVGGALAITAWGIANWDYFDRSPHASSEGWFGKETKSGGADKIGHLFTSYVLDRGLSALYRSWGYETRTAARHAAWSSFGLLGLMELGDSFSSEFGFSHEDMIMNGLGSFIGYQLETRPALARKIDLRVEYAPDSDSEIDIFTDYENSKYLLAVKLDGFDAVTNPLLEHLELHAGYYTRGFDDPNREKQRTGYLGIGINFSKLLRDRDYNKTATFLNYYQIPGTSLTFEP